MPKPEKVTATFNAELFDDGRAFVRFEFPAGVDPEAMAATSGAQMAELVGPFMCWPCKGETHFKFDWSEGHMKPSVNIDGSVDLIWTFFSKLPEATVLGTMLAGGVKNSKGAN